MKGQLKLLRTLKAKNPKRIEFLKALVPKLRSLDNKKPGVIKVDNEEADRIENAFRALS